MWNKEAVDADDGDADHDHADRDVIQLAAGFRGDRLAAIDRRLLLDTLRRQFVDPRKDNGHRESQQEDHQHDAVGPIGQAHQVEQQIPHLQDQPGEHRVSDGDAEDVATLDLGQQFQDRTLQGRPVE